MTASQTETIHREEQVLPEELTSHLDGIQALCERYRMRTLYVFGSAVHGTFDPATSDLDFLVDLGEYDAGVLGRFLDFQDELARLLGRDIDLITVGSTGHRRFLNEVHATKVSIYAA